MAMYSLKILRVSNCRLRSRWAVLLLGDEDDAAGVAVEAMDDAGPVVAVEVAELGEVETQGVDQRAGPVPLAGCTTMSAGLFTTAR